jgi:hypothetical protein
MSTRDICIGLGIVAALWFAKYHRQRRSQLPFPPGPPKLPVIGHLLQLPGPGSPVWETWAEWSEKYGASPFLCVLIRADANYLSQATILFTLKFPSPERLLSLSTP